MFLSNADARWIWVALVSVTVVAFPAFGTARESYRPGRLPAAAGAPECVYYLSHTKTAVAQSGGTGLVDVYTDPACSWSAVSQANWITLVGQTSFTGYRRLTYTVAPNALGIRTGTLNIAGQTFTINQGPLVHTDHP